MSNIDYKILYRNDDVLYEMIENEINKQFTFRKLCKNINTQDLINTEENPDDFRMNQCYYMCNKNVNSIKTCKGNSIDNIIVKSRQIKKLKILKKTYVSDNDQELSIVSIATTNINGVDNKVIVKDFQDEYEMMYELFIANILKNDPIIEHHICGYYGKKDNSKLLLEYVQGKTITELTNLNIKEFSDIISQIFFVLNYAYNKYGFIHGDLHLDNFLILHNKNVDEMFDIELPLSNGKYIKYKSHYRVVFLDFGLSHLKYKFRENDNNRIVHVNMLPLEEEIMWFSNSIPLVDISKFVVHLMIDIIYENKHRKLTEVGVYITNFIQYLYSMIGKPNITVNSEFFDKAYDKYSYLYDLIDANLDISFEELYVKFVSNTKMDIHKIENYYNKDEFEKLEGKSLRDELDDTELVMKIIHNITQENVKLSKKINNISEFVEDLKKLEINNYKITNEHYKDIKKKFSSEQLKYICLNLYHYTCKYELNKNVFSNENDMITTVNKLYNLFTKNDILGEISELDKYKVIDNLIEFKINKFLDCYLENTDIHNVLTKYNKLNKIAIEQTENLTDVNYKLNKTMKMLFTKNYNKMPHKIFQKNFIDNEINVKKFNCIEQIKYLSNIVYQLKKQMVKFDNIDLQSDIKKGVVNMIFATHKSKSYHIRLFFYKMYKYCEKYSLSILDNAKDDYIDWISYNRIILYDYYIRHISISNIPNTFTKIYFDLLELEDEIWEKFYKKSGFNDFANSITFSENMLNLLTNNKLPKLVNKLKSQDQKSQVIINNMKTKLESLDTKAFDSEEDLIKPFKKMYIGY